MFTLTLPPVWKVLAFIKDADEEQKSREWFFIFVDQWGCRRCTVSGNTSFLRRTLSLRQGLHVVKLCAAKWCWKKNANSTKTLLHILHSLMFSFHQLKGSAGEKKAFKAVKAVRALFYLHFHIHFNINTNTHSHFSFCKTNNRSPTLPGLSGGVRALSGSMKLDCLVGLWLGSGTSWGFCSAK